jgi:hypothetical protein
MQGQDDGKKQYKHLAGREVGVPHGLHAAVGGDPATRVALQAQVQAVEPEPARAKESGPLRHAGCAQATAASNFSLLRFY